METKNYAPRFKGKYSEEVIPALMKKFGYKSVMQVPKLSKISINRGVNGAVNDKKLVDIARPINYYKWSKSCSNNV